MGVKYLWAVIGGAGEATDLRELQGQSVAIDLAGWAVSGNQCKGMHRGGVSKPHLRNLFFRTSALIALNIKPVFVLDGAAPELKRDTLDYRRTHQTEARQSQKTQSLSRNRLKGVMNECSEMLISLGVPFVRAEGEAEAYAAMMNAEGHVDGVITDDSDSFCYGAKTVLRNFSISGTNSSGRSQAVELYTMDKLKTHLNLDRRRLIFMAIVLGCDFCPSGIPKLGKETVKNILTSWPLSWDPIRILNLWREQNFRMSTPARRGAEFECFTCDGTSHCSDCNSWRYKITNRQGCHCDFLRNKENLKLEDTVKKRCKEFDCDEFWTDILPGVVDEFERTKTISASKKKKTVAESTSLSESKICNIPDTKLFAKRPDLKKFISIAVEKLSWTEEYAIEKFSPMLARWQVTNDTGPKCLNAEKIVKKKTVNGQPGYLVDWTPCDINDLLPFQTAESVEHLMNAYPELITEFEKGRPKKKATKRTKVNGPGQNPITKFFGASPMRKKAPPPPAETPTSSKYDVTKSDLYHRVFFQSPIPSPQVSSTPMRFEFKTPMRLKVLKELMDDDLSLNDTSSDNDLSFVVDDIIGNGLQDKENVVRSTPATKNRPEDFEDSFDRMCL